VLSLEALALDELEVAGRVLEGRETRPRRAFRSAGATPARRGQHR
jgi:hypothetical protein